MEFFTNLKLNKSIKFKDKKGGGGINYRTSTKSIIQNYLIRRQKYYYYIIRLH